LGSSCRTASATVTPTFRAWLAPVLSALLGALGAVPLAAQDTLAAASRTRVSGVVFDSVRSRPLGNARVRLVPYRDPAAATVATSDGAGRFTFDSVAAGTWLVTALHPVFDSLVLEPPLARIDVRDSTPISLVLATPSAPALIVARCGTATGADLGLLYGVIRSAIDDAPVAGASLSAEWPEWVILRGQRGLKLEPRRITATADSIGRFVLCGVPATSTVRVVAWGGRDSTGMIAVEIPETGIVRHDLSVGRAERIGTTVASDSLTAGAMDSVTVRRGRAVVRGVAMGSNGRPVAGATVRVLGSGNAGRAGDDGSFVVTGVVAGTQTVEARAIGFQPQRATLELRDDATTTVTLTLSPQTVLLDTVRVTAGRSVDPAVLDFERRWRRGTGVFMDHRSVRERAPIFVTDALRALNGVRIVPVGGYGQRVILRGSFGECSANVFVDGVPVNQPSTTSMGEMLLDDLVSPSDVAAIEVYARSATMPAQYQNMNGCGAVAVWTFRRFAGVAPKDPQRR